MEESNTENTPALLTEPLNRKQILRFVKIWKSLQQRDRRMIRKNGIIFDNPYEALEAIKMVIYEICFARTGGIIDDIFREKSVLNMF